MGDFWKCQTFAASPAEPGDLPWWVRPRTSHTHEGVLSDCFISGQMGFTRQIQQEAPPLLTGLCLAVRAAYLRVAHIYMLISIPTDTSTIFGAFQAIFALLLLPDEALSN